MTKLEKDFEAWLASEEFPLAYPTKRDLLKAGARWATDRAAKKFEGALQDARTGRRTWKQIIAEIRGEEPVEGKLE